MRLKSCRLNAAVHAHLFSQSDDELDIEAELGIELAKTDDEAEESEEEEEEAQREEGQRPGSADSAAAAKQLQQQLSKKVRGGEGGWEVCTGRMHWESRQCAAEWSRDAVE